MKTIKKVKLIQLVPKKNSILAKKSNPGLIRNSQLIGFASRLPFLKYKKL